MQNTDLSKRHIAIEPDCTDTKLGQESNNTIYRHYPAPDSDEHQTARLVLEQIFRKRRLLPKQTEESDRSSEFEPHISSVLSSIIKREPIKMILPGFPAKSPNRGKTLGALPDLAEKHALENLSMLCDRIRAVYTAGAEIIICSDGRVFADLVRIPDKDVTAYGDYLRKYAYTEHGAIFSFFNLDDAFEKIESHEILREELLIHYGESIASLRRRCKEEKEAKEMYLGITRFIFEDYCGLDAFHDHSRTSIQKIARLVSYRVIQRSNAWSRLLKKRFPNAVRLSIHPQFRISKKVGVYLGETNGDCWLTPWHSVAIRDAGKITFCKRSDAEKEGMLAYREGRPSHFEKVDTTSDWGN